MHGARIACGLALVLATTEVAAAQGEATTPTEPAPTTTEPAAGNATDPASAEPAAPDPAGDTGGVAIDGAVPVLEPPPPAPPTFAWKPYGYLRLKAAVVQNDPNVAFVGRDDGFSLQNARLGVTGELADKAFFKVSFDGAVDERNQINSPDGKLKVGLRDAFVDLHLGTIDLRAGRFDPLFDPDKLVDDEDRPFVDRALESRGVRPTDGWQTPGLPPGRSLGVALRKDPGEIESGVGLGFEVAVQNGADEFSSDNDNDLPAVSAALLLRLPRGVASAGFRWNARTEGDLPFQQDETDLAGAVGVALAAGPIELAAGGVVVHTIFDTTGGPAQNAYGGHAQAMYVFGGGRPIGVGYRFGILDPSDLVLTDRLMEHTVGAIVVLREWHLRAQLNVTHVMEQADRDLSNDRVEAALQVDL
jgi:hypothetical protein